MNESTKKWAALARRARAQQVIPGVDRRVKPRPDHETNERAAAAMLLLLAGEIDRAEFLRRLVRA